MYTHIKTEEHYCTSSNQDFKFLCVPKVVWYHMHLTQQKANAIVCVYKDKENVSALTTTFFSIKILVIMSNVHPKF